VKNQEIKIKPVETQRLNVIDEYDNDEICSLFEQYKHIIIRAEYGGSGKSYACAYMRKKGYNVLFVSPTNVLSKELIKDYQSESITITLFIVKWHTIAKYYTIPEKSTNHCVKNSIILYQQL
jgi:hypothetical protein